MKIVIFGAGSVGTYIGGSLLAAGSDVLLIGRTKMAEHIAMYGVHLTSLDGRSIKLDSHCIPYTEDPAALGEGDLILVTVKSADTVTVANAIYTYAKQSALIVSLQSGVGNVEALRERLTGWAVLEGMVPFSVKQMPDGRFHRATSGELMVDAFPVIVPWREAFKLARLPLSERRDVREAQWGRLLLNLNGSLNALSSLPIKRQLLQRTYRFCLALLIEEALTVLNAAGIRPLRASRVPPRLLSQFLRLPDALFRRMAGSMLRIDPHTRSSMWEDLQAGRRTEIDYLNGAVVALAKSLGREAPANQRIVELIQAAHRGRMRAYDPDTLYRLLVAEAGNGNAASVMASSR